MQNIYAVLWITFKEGLRQRVLYGVVIFALFLMTFAVLISGWFMRDISKVILDFCFSAISIGGLLVPFFLAINLLSKDIERKTIFSILATPVSRSGYILGKFGGLALIVAVVMLILSGASLIALYGGKALYGERFFTSFSFAAFVQNIVMSWLGIVVLLSMVVLWCSVTTSSFLATLLTLTTYFIGHTIDDVVRFVTTETPGVMISQSVKLAVLCVQYLAPNLAAFDLKLQAAHNLIMPSHELAMLILYGVTYSSIALSLAVLIFRKRDLV